jgi:hypothetical protein
LKLVFQLLIEVQNRKRIIGSHKELKYYANLKEVYVYTLTKNRNYPKAKEHNIKYCRILKKVTKEAKSSTMIAL